MYVQCNNFSWYLSCIYSSKLVDSCDDSESEDEEDSKSDCLSCCEEEEKFVFYGAVSDQSDTKSDHGGKDEEIVTIEQRQILMSSDDSFDPNVGTAKEADQQCMGEEVDDDRENQQPMLPHSTRKETAADQVLREAPQDHNGGRCGEMFLDNTPND